MHDELLPSPGFDAQPYFSDRLRLLFEARDEAPGEAERSALCADARTLLGRLLALEDGAAARTEDDKEPSPELLRLERKLDLVLELLAYRLNDTTAAPERPVRVSAAGACWRQAEPMVERPFGIVSIHLHRLLPRPLRLPVRRLQAAAEGQVEVAFLDLDEECEDLLVRYVFLQHRRQLAGHRRLRR